MVLLIINKINKNLNTRRQFETDVRYKACNKARNKVKILESKLVWIKNKHWASKDNSTDFTAFHIPETLKQKS